MSAMLRTAAIVSACVFTAPSAAGAAEVAENSVFNIESRTHRAYAEASMALSSFGEFEVPDDSVFLRLAPSFAVRGGYYVLPYLALEGGAGYIGGQTSGFMSDDEADFARVSVFGGARVALPVVLTPFAAVHVGYVHGESTWQDRESCIADCPGFFSNNGYRGEQSLDAAVTRLEGGLQLAWDNYFGGLSVQHVRLLLVDQSHEISVMGNPAPETSASRPRTASAGDALETAFTVSLGVRF